MQPRNNCHCGSAKWKKQGDSYVCQYGHQFTEVEEVGDDDLLYGSQQRERTKNKQKKAKEKEGRRTPSNQTIFLFYQTVLKLQIKWMLKTKIDIPEFENIVCHIWILWTSKFVYRLPDIDGEMTVTKIPKLTATEIRPIYTIIFCNLALWVLRIPYPLSDYIKWIYDDGFPYIYNEAEKIDWPNHSSLITIPSISDLIKHQHRILSSLEALGMPIYPPYQSPMFVRRIFVELDISGEFYPFYCKIYELVYENSAPEIYKLKHGVQTCSIALMLAKLNSEHKRLNNVMLEYFFGKSKESSLPFNFDNILEKSLYPLKGDVSNLIRNHFEKPEETENNQEYECIVGDFEDLEKQVIKSYDPDDENGALDSQSIINNWLRYSKIAPRSVENRVTHRKVDFINPLFTMNNEKAKCCHVKIMYNKQELKKLELNDALLKVPRVRLKQNTKELGFLKEYKKILNRPFDPNFKSYWAHSTAGVLTNTQIENIVHHKNPLLEKKFPKKQIILEPIKKPETPIPEHKCKKKHRKNHKSSCKYYLKEPLITPAAVEEHLNKSLENNIALEVKEQEIQAPSMEFKFEVEEAPQVEYESHSASSDEESDDVDGKDVSIDDSTNISVDPFQPLPNESGESSGEKSKPQTPFDPIKPPTPSDILKSPISINKPLVNPAVQLLKVDSLPQSPILRKKLPFQPVHRLQLERRLSFVKDSLGSFNKPVPISVVNTSSGSFIVPQPSNSAKAVPSSPASQPTNNWITSEFESTSSLNGIQANIGASSLNLATVDTSSTGSLHIKLVRPDSLDFLPELILPPFIKQSYFRWKTAIYVVLQQQRLTEIPNMSQTEVKLNLSNFEIPTFKTERQVVLNALTGVYKLAACKTAKEKDFKVDMKYLPFDETLCYFPYLKKQKLSVRLAIAGSSWLETIPRGKKIIREGDPVRIVYFLLSGLCVEHVKIDQPIDSQETAKEDLIRLMKPSDTIGDIAGNVVTTRAFSLTTLTHCLFICIERQEWLSCMRKGNFDIQKIEILSTLGTFIGLPPQTLEHLSSYTSETSIGLDEQIIEPHEEPEDYYFIAKGKVKLIINLPFIKTVTDESKDLVAPEKFQVIPYYGQSVNPDKDEFVYISHTIGELNPGDFFPPISHDHRGMYKLYSVRTLENTDCLIFNKLKAQEEVQFLNDFQVRELQEHYLSTKGWRSDADTALSKMLADEIDKERNVQVLERYKKANTRH
ncbi:hypothetical protein HDV06_001320 [Boothiomyces sp. JEL0866]|nr:hypothetical protein HDV06_001320 [Boothiomyces sp. JEL0866]